MTPRLNLLGKKYGRLTVIADPGNTKHQKSKWICVCSCGNTCIVRGGDLQSRNTQSCGCLKIERIRERSNKTLEGLKNEYSNF